jgi:hypothetical protein
LFLVGYSSVPLPRAVMVNGNQGHPKQLGASSLFWVVTVIG